MQEALQYLTAQLKNHKNHEIKADIVQKIAQLQNRQATDFLIDLLGEPQINIANRLRILCALPLTHDARVPDIIWDYARQEFPPPIPIMELLGANREIRAVPILAKALNTKGLYAGERITAAIALGQIGDDRAVPALVEALGEDRTFVGFERVWIPKNIALSDYVLQALKVINTETTVRAIQTWEQKYHERALVRVDKFIRLVNEHQYVRWQHNEELLRLGHYAIDVVSQLSLHEGKGFKHVLNKIFLGMNKYPEMIPQSAKAKILNFVIFEFENTTHSIYSPSFFDVIAHFDDESINEFAIEWLVDGQNKQQSEALRLLAKRRVRQAIPIIEEMLYGALPFLGKPVALFKALAEIGGVEAKIIIEQHLDSADISLKATFLESYTDLYFGTDKALALIDVLINHKDTRIQIRAIQSLTKGADGAFYILISLLNSSRQQRLAVLSALRQLADARALPYLVAQLKNSPLDRDLRKTLEAIFSESAFAILNAWDAPHHDLPMS